ncbi:MAG: hypothetical protein WC068_16375 [Caulobacter sp.]
MTQSRQRREKPAPTTPQEDAELEARYRLLHRKLKRFAARMEARYPGHFDQTRQSSEAPPSPARGDAEPGGT